MKTYGWIVTIIAVFLLGYLFYHVAVGRRQQAAAVAYEVSADSIRVYQDRIVQLDARAARFREDYKDAGTIQRLAIDRQLDLLDRRIRDLKVAVEQWKSSRDATSGGDLYTKCALLYGSASGVCEALDEQRVPGK
jgi:hypothetical protein